MPSGEQELVESQQKLVFSWRGEKYVAAFPKLMRDNGLTHSDLGTPRSGGSKSPHHDIETMLFKLREELVLASALPHGASALAGCKAGNQIRLRTARAALLKPDPWPVLTGADA
jgi:hypothetical protein